MEVQPRQKHESKTGVPGQPEGDSAPSPEQIKAINARRSKSFSQAKVARHYLVPASLSGIVGEQYLDAMSAHDYMNVAMREAGDPKDLVERVLLEQFLLLHHHVATLHPTAANAKSPNAVKVYYSMLARMSGELRRFAQTIKTYRQPAAQKTFSVVKQQNVVANGEQTVTYVTSSKKKKETLTAKSKLKDKAPDSIEKRINGDGNLNQESQARGSRSKKRRSEKAVV